MRPAPAVAALALATVLAAPAPAEETALLPPGTLEALEPAVASCVLAHLDAARTAIAARLLVKACQKLAAAARDPVPDEDQIFVKCKVAGDPEWIEFRLVTRRQCAAAAGRVQG